jgi:hypothetical protein
LNFDKKNGTKTNVQSREAAPLITKVSGKCFYIKKEILLFFFKENGNFILFSKKIRIILLHFLLGK